MNMWQMEKEDVEGRSIVLKKKETLVYCEEFEQIKIFI